MSTRRFTVPLSAFGELGTGSLTCGVDEVVIDQKPWNEFAVSQKRAMRALIGLDVFLGSARLSKATKRALVDVGFDVAVAFLNTTLHNGVYDYEFRAGRLDQSKPIQFWALQGTVGDMRLCAPPHLLDAQARTLFTCVRETVHFVTDQADFGVPTFVGPD